MFDQISLDNQLIICETSDHFTIFQDVSILVILSYFESQVEDVLTVGVVLEYLLDSPDLEVDWLSRPADSKGRQAFSPHLAPGLRRSSVGPCLGR